MKIEEFRPVNGNLILALPALKEKNAAGVILNQAAQLQEAVKVTQPFQVLAVDTNDHGISVGDFVYMHPQQFISPVVIEYPFMAGTKVVIASIFEVVGVKKSKSKFKLEKNISLT